MIPPDMILQSAIAGIPVFDWQDPWVRSELAGRAGLPDDFDLRYDEVYVARSVMAILVGEKAHFEYRLRCVRDNEVTRVAASTMIKVRAQKILGEPWELSSR